MAKKKKMQPADMLVDTLEQMLGMLPPDQREEILSGLEMMAAEGKGLLDVANDNYAYQRPDYSKDAQPLEESLRPLADAALPSEALAAYAQVKETMAKMSQQEQEALLRNYFQYILVDGMTRDFKHEKEASNMPLLAAFQLVDDFQLSGLFDIILETLKQAPYFYEFYYGGFEDAGSLILAHVGVDHLDELKEVMKTDGFTAEIYPVIFDAVVQMAVENPFCRMQVLCWAADVLKTCVGITIPPLSLDMLVKSLAQIKAIDLLPLLKDLYKKYDSPHTDIKGGIKGVTRLLTKGTDEPVVSYANFKEILEQLQEGEENDFEFDGDDYEDWLDDDEEWFDDDEEDDRDSDALFYKECGFTPNKPKSQPKPAKKTSQKYALTLDVALKGSPRKVYRQLVVPSTLNLEDLGEILVCAVGWDGDHLNQFIDGEEYYSGPKEYDWEIEDNDARQFTIGQLLRRVNAKIKWEYDFGDSWMHEIKLVEKRKLDASEEVEVQLLKATGACPPEDCGGTGGYRHLLNVLKDPGCEEYDEMVDWLGGRFDPKSFNIEAARRRIKGYMSDKE